MDGANARITAEVTSWAGIEATTGSRGEDDLRDVVALLRLNYDRALERHGLPEAA